MHAYTRDDGTQVKEHWRSKPDGSNNEDSITDGSANIIEQYSQNEKQKFDNVRTRVGYNINNSQKILININNDKNDKYPNAKDCMNISILGPENIINNSEFKVLDDNNSKFLSSEIGINLDNGFKTVKFDKNSSLAQNINNSSELKEQLVQNIDKLQNGKPLQISFNQDPNLFRSLHNATIVNPKIEDGKLKAYLYDFYDFDYNYNYYNYNNFDSYMRNFEITTANNFAAFFQDTGVIKNYNIVVPIEINLKI